MSEDLSVFRLTTDLGAVRAAAETAVAGWRARHAPHLPETADIQHVGATAIDGCATKGDLDIAVRVTPDSFEAARAYLDRTHPKNTGSVRTDSFAAYEQSSATPALGVQLVVVGSEFDLFLAFREALRANPEKVTRYNALRRAFDGRPMVEYRAAKSAFIREVLGLT